MTQSGSNQEFVGSGWEKSRRTSVTKQLFRQIFQSSASRICVYSIAAIPARAMLQFWLKLGRENGHIAWRLTPVFPDQSGVQRAEYLSEWKVAE
jgi:hypothetical protein